MQSFKKTLVHCQDKKKKQLTTASLPKYGYLNGLVTTPFQRQAQTKPYTQGPIIFLSDNPINLRQRRIPQFPWPFSQNIHNTQVRGWVSSTKLSNLELGQLWTRPWPCYISVHNYAHISFFFVCYLAATWPTLSHCWGFNLTNPIST